MKTWVTSDCHFGHGNIIKYCPSTRPFVDANDMTVKMVTYWNELVSDDDTVYILGDVCFGDVNKAIETVSSLNGRKILIKGNHDGKFLKHKEFRDCFVSIHDYLEVEVNKTLVCLFHYPMKMWNKMHHGSVHLYGHVHGDTTGLEYFRARDVGMDATGNVVCDLEDVVQEALTGYIQDHH